VKTRAPGKVVLSGAYSVLTGAPAIVSAVDRYATADSDLPAGFVTDEMRAAFAGPYPQIDAAQLRQGERKLGLGSSAAILVAVLACRRWAEPAPTGSQNPAQPADSGPEGLFAEALLAHRRAQRGGSGVDVAASTFGGTLVCRLPVALTPGAPEAALLALPEISPTTLPAVHIEVWSSPWQASTGDYLRRVFAWGAQHPQDFEALFARLTSGAKRAVLACQQQDAARFITALDEQSLALQELGEGSGTDIFVPPVAALAAQARAAGSCVLPAGAGGGDITLYVGAAPPSATLMRARDAAGLSLLPIALHARGVHCAP
jgi:phosphomevalonate kinase